MVYQEGELEGFDFRLLDLIVLKACQPFRILDLFICPSDLLVSQVQLDLKPLQGRISQFRLGDRRRQSVDLDDSTLPLSELWENSEQPRARHIHIFVQLPKRDADSESLPPIS